MTWLWPYYTPYAFILGWVILGASLAVLAANLFLPWERFRAGGGGQQARLMFTPAATGPAGVLSPRPITVNDGELPDWCRHVSTILFVMFCVLALAGLVNLALNFIYVLQHGGSRTINKSAAANIFPVVIAFAMRKTWWPS